KPPSALRGRKPTSRWLRTKLPRLSAWPSMARSTLDIVVAPAGEHQAAGIREAPRDCEHFLLRLQHLGEAQRAALGHLVADRIRRAGRHAAQHLLAQFLV